MKLPRRNFLHLAAGAAAPPMSSRIARHEPIRRVLFGDRTIRPGRRHRRPSHGSTVVRAARRGRVDLNHPSNVGNRGSQDRTHALQQQGPQAAMTCVVTLVKAASASRR